MARNYIVFAAFKSGIDTKEPNDDCWISMEGLSAKFNVCMRFNRHLVGLPWRITT